MEVVNQIKVESHETSEKGPLHCLLCSSQICTSSDGNNSVKRATLADFGVEIVGGQNCSILAHQLEQIFILVKILDVPKCWCEQVLLRGGRHEAGDITVGFEGQTFGNDESWFQVCSECVEKKVSKAWEIYQRIVALQGQLVKVKEKIKEGMRRGIAACSLESQRCVGVEGNIDYEIKKLLFPDLFSGSGLTTFDDEVVQDFQQENNNLEGSHDHSEDLESVGSPNFKDKLKDLPVKRRRKKRKLRSSKKLKKSSDCVQVELKPDVTITKETVENDETESTESVPDYFKDDENPDPKEDTDHSDYASRSNKIYPRKRRNGPYKREHHRWQTCRECDTRCRNPEEYKAHRQAHEEVKTQAKYVCVLCTFPARTAKELKAHKRSRHKGPQISHKERKYFDCTKCPVRTEVWKHLKEHVNQEHPSMTEEELEEAGVLLKCHLCGGKEFENMQRWTTHKMKVHLELEALGQGEEALQPIVCPECGVKFASKKFLENHLRMTHKKKSRFVCDECGMGFEYQSLLDRHKITHLDKSLREQFICDLCGLDFFLERQLKTHHARSHAGKSKPSSSNLTSELFKCRYCPLTSPIDLVIKRHQETHKEELGHRCDHCGKYYSSAQGLIRHIRINHTDSKWECPYCSKRFPCEEYMIRHIKENCHLKMLESLDKGPCGDLGDAGVTT